MKNLSTALTVMVYVLIVLLVSGEVRDWHDYLFSNGCLVTLKDPLPSADRHAQGLDQEGHPIVAQGSVPCLTDSECAETFGGDGGPVPSRLK